MEQFLQGHDQRFAVYLFYEYLLTLGEFDIDHLTESEDRLSPLIMFVTTTFLIQIVLLNMLIAIMSDTFDKVYDQKTTANLRERVDFLKNNFRRRKVSNQDQRFMFNIQPLDIQYEDMGWLGRLQDLKNSYEKGNAKLQDMVHQKLMHMERKIQENKMYMKSVNTQMNALSISFEQQSKIYETGLKGIAPIMTKLEQMNVKMDSNENKHTNEQNNMLNELKKFIKEEINRDKEEAKKAEEDAKKKKEEKKDEEKKEEEKKEEAK